jgi:hypothetical protein
MAQTYCRSNDCLYSKTLGEKVDKQMTEFSNEDIQESDIDRSDTYCLAADLNAYLENLERNLQDVVVDFNDARYICLFVIFFYSLFFGLFYKFLLMLYPFSEADWTMTR